jgi:3-dehydroquinate synthase class II
LKRKNNKEQTNQTGKSMSKNNNAELAPGTTVTVCDTSGMQVNATITEPAIDKACQVLIDNGIEPEEADTVLQAVCYALLDFEIFPEK